MARARAIGATAISSVMRSVAIRRSTSSRSNRRCSRTVAPADDRGQQVEQPEDVRRRGGHLEAVVGTEAESVHQCTVAWPIEQWVWRTALGSPVVPELKTRTASSAAGDPAGCGPGAGCRRTGSVDGSSRSVTASGAQAFGQQRRPRRRRPPRAPGRSVRGRGRTSAAFQAGLSSTAAAPSLLMAWTATMNSTRLAVISATRSPAATPRAAR